jgi:hypothetical protein
MTAPGLYGPFSNNFGLVFVLLICGWVYVRTENLIVAFLLYASLPWFLNFIQVASFQTPTVVGSIATGVFVLLGVLVIVESYRLWAPYITFEPFLQKSKLEDQAIDSNSPDAFTPAV